VIDAFPDHYAALGVQRDATAEEIKQAYRARAKASHPDRNPNDSGAADRFRAVNEAYRTLSDAQLRAGYDRRLNLGRVGADPLADITSILDAAFGRAFAEDVLRSYGGARYSRYVPPVRTEVTVPFELAFKGGNGEIEVSGRRIPVMVPAGTVDGDQEIFSGVLAGPGLSGGDVVVTFRVGEHESYTLSGRHILVGVRVPAWRMALGGTIGVESIDGAVSFTVPAGAQHGQTVRISGRGFPDRGGRTRGDLLVRLEVVIPTRMSPAERTAWEALAAESGSVRPRKGWLARLVQRCRAALS
jgi:DnaJ-class molecular chaperone